MPVNDPDESQDGKPFFLPRKKSLIQDTSQKPVYTVGESTADVLDGITALMARFPEDLTTVTKSIG